MQQQQLMPLHITNTDMDIILILILTILRRRVRLLQDITVGTHSMHSNGPYTLLQQVLQHILTHLNVRQALLHMLMQQAVVRVAVGQSLPSDLPQLHIHILILTVVVAAAAAAAVVVEEDKKEVQEMAIPIHPGWIFYLVQPPRVPRTRRRLAIHPIAGLVLEA